MSEALKQFVSGLYSQLPGSPLYHYTSIDAAQIILKDGAIRATEVRYFSDASELQVARDAVAAVVRDRTKEGTENNVLSQFEKWVSQRVSYGPMVFAACFTTAGNLLSQWRGYTPIGKGLSLGFHPSHVHECAKEQDYRVGRCIYDWNEQYRIISRIVDELEAYCESLGPNPKGHPDQNYMARFIETEADFLQAAALMKNSAYKEEQEWRVVSATLSNYVTTPISFKPANTTLIPFKLFQLKRRHQAVVQLEHVFLGPTSHHNGSMHAFTMLCGQHGCSPRRGTQACQIPYRQL
jgi:hypothetical protein